MTFEADVRRTKNTNLFVKLKKKMLTIKMDTLPVNFHKDEKANQIPVFLGVMQHSDLFYFVLPL